MTTVPPHVLAAFGVTGGGEALAARLGIVRSGDYVLKRLEAASLENDRSFELAEWLGSVLDGVRENGFRVARPLAARDGRYLVDGWTAQRYLAGRPVTTTHAAQVIAAIRALHAELAGVEPHPALATNATAWGKAERECWAEAPAPVHTRLTRAFGELLARRAPLPALPLQLIHGDLNPSNVVIAPGQAPGFLDFTPFWAPIDFAVASFACWLGPRQGDASVLSVFAQEPHFDQLLLRAALRMLLVVSYLDGVADCDDELRAAELVIAYLDRRRH